MLTDKKEIINRMKIPEIQTQVITTERQYEDYNNKFIWIGCWRLIILCSAVLTAVSEK